MTKREWQKWCNDNAAMFARSGLSARQVAILAEAHASFLADKESSRQNIPILLPDGVPVEYDSEEVLDLENRGLIRRQIAKNGARHLTITSMGDDMLSRIFALVG